MNYTSTIRSFCQNKAGSIIDVAQVSEDYFAMVPYKTLLKVLNRLRDEGLLIPVSKGVYMVKPEAPISSDEAIIREYATETRGMLAGNALFRELGLTDYDSGTTEIYTRLIPKGSHKNIGRYSLTGVNLFFEPELKNLIALLEIIEKGHTNPEHNLPGHSVKIMELLSEYTQSRFRSVVENISYSYSTIATLSYYLTLLRKDDGNCLEIYKGVENGR